MQNFTILKENSFIKWLVVTICFLHGIHIYAQQNITRDLNILGNFHSGYNLPEYPFVSSITEDYIRSIDICFYKETFGKNIWEQLYNYPAYGVSFFYSSLGNNEIFGRELALTYFFKIYFSNYKNRLRLFNRTGIGISYVNRKFDLQTNYLNVAVGSNFNIHFNFRLGAEYKLSDRFNLNTGISFNHFSNANTSEPNLGINYLTGFGGVSYRIGEKSKKKVYDTEPHTKENSLTFFASVGGKHSRALSSEYFLTSSFSTEFNRAFFRRVHFGIGADLFYISSVKSEMEKNNKEFRESYSFQSGIHLSQSLVYNKFRISIQEGVYLFLTERTNNYRIYNRAIFQRQVNDHLSVRLAMKSHLHILDFPEIGFGYTF